MEYEKLSYQLRLIELLAQGNFFSVNELAERIDLNPRTVYRNLDGFPALGLWLEKQGFRYRLDPESPFLERVSDRLRFSPDEVVTLAQVLHAVHDQSPQVRRLREKLAQVYDGGVLVPHDVDEAVGRNIRHLFEAIRQQRTVILRGYVSAHSGERRDRVVEPFAFLTGNREVRCYELASAMNKTFSVSRAAEVVVLDVRWGNADAHRPLFTDLFHFSSDAPFGLRLRLGILAKSVLVDEYPQAVAMLTPDGDKHWRLEGDFCSFKGIGRFVLGLFDDVEVEESPEFSAYLNEKIRLFQERVKNN